MTETACPLSCSPARAVQGSPPYHAPPMPVHRRDGRHLWRGRRCIDLRSLREEEAVWASWDCEQWCVACARGPSMWPLLSSPLAYFFLPGIFWILSHVVQSHPTASFGAQLSRYPCLYTDS